MSKGVQIIHAIDPGPKESALVSIGSDARIRHYEQAENSVLRQKLCGARNNPYYQPALLVIEYTPPYALTTKGGRANVPREVVDTAIEIGRFIECFGGEFELLHRQRVKSQLTGLANSKDGQVIDALCDRYGGSRKDAKGTKKCPGPLFGLKADLWQALAVGRAWWELNVGKW
jgi:hypothetical protein